ncbi:glycoside hydrolase family 13 protein [Anaeromicropila herbilytica]|uniref:Alpha-glycosidase n=1 Tax=Anaeromicropila herbilytica TaxID=2785025 RepID=A0A7R7ID23_9FIRM|nr:glycoside hydrolase family 13 protein [Anaeromicropila herbilytica]BCN31338.1 alpha-glycosidase [Anaeromicropila herbilytica]
MDKSAILHIPLSKYAFANTEKEMTIRLRAKKKDLTSCILYYADRACNHTPIDFTSIPMKVIAEDEMFEYYEATFETPYVRVCYYFELWQNDKWTYYYADQFTNKLADIKVNNSVIEGRSEYYQYPYILREEVVDVPEWFKNAVVYNIFPDSFASDERILLCETPEIEIDGKKHKRRLGGTIKGIMSNLDYIKELGFDCIYLNPIFSAGEYHKYDILDYYHIDPCLGTDEEFRELVNEIHNRDMHIIIDGVFNHCSWEFFAFEDVVCNGLNSKYKDWFYELKYPVIKPDNSTDTPNYACFAYERKMPKLNTSNKEVQEYFEKVCRYWIREFKIDGWRLDVANEIDRNFWRGFRKAAKEEDPNIVLIGEVWENSETWLRGDAFDSTMNYDFRKHCRDYFALNIEDAITFSWNINQMRLRYPTNISDSQLNLLDSHDVPRFLSLCKDDVDKWKLAFIFLMLAPGVPSMFYGDEKGISGITENEYRSPMVWEESNTTMKQFVKKIISIRKEYVDYRSNYEQYVSENNSQLFTFARSNQKLKILIYMNVSNEKVKVELPSDEMLILGERIENGGIQSWGYCIYLMETGTILA